MPVDRDGATLSMCGTSAALRVSAWFQADAARSGGLASASNCLPGGFARHTVSCFMRLSFVTSGLALLAVFGCSLAARERLKHFFFEVPVAEAGDGVGQAGNANHVVPVEDRPTLTLPPGRFVSVHEPFRSHDCEVCHNADAQMSVNTDNEETCGACHDRYFSSEVGHAPVAGGECLLCHDPHRSAFPALLLSAIGENCAQCHDAAEDLSQPAHAEAEGTNCTKCHDPHFGEPPLLRPGVGGPQEDKQVEP